MAVSQGLYASWKIWNFVATHKNLELPVLS